MATKPIPVAKPQGKEATAEVVAAAATYHHWQLMVRAMLVRIADDIDAITADMGRPDSRLVGVVTPWRIDDLRRHVCHARGCAGEGVDGPRIEVALPSPFVKK